MPQYEGAGHAEHFQSNGVSTEGAVNFLFEWQTQLKPRTLETSGSEVLPLQSEG